MSAVVKINGIRRDGGTQIRGGLQEDVIASYVEALAAGDVFDPIVVYCDDGGEFWLADGFHRVEAHLRAGKTEINAKVLEGSQRDAVLHACGANAAHGLRRSNEDKRRAVTTLLNDPEWAKWSDRKIADVCKVSHTFVASLRSGNVASERTYTTKHDTEAKMRTERIGRRPKGLHCEVYDGFSDGDRCLNCATSETSVVEQHDDAPEAHESTPDAPEAEGLPAFVRSALLDYLHRREGESFTYEEGLFDRIEYEETTEEGSAITRGVYARSLYVAPEHALLEWVKRNQEEVTKCKAIYDFLAPLTQSEEELLASNPFPESLARRREWILTFANNARAKRARVEARKARDARKAARAAKVAS